MAKKKNHSDRRGFASMMDSEDGRARQREIASEGGRAAHESGHAHEFTKGSQEAREAGRKGGRSSRRRRS